MHCIFTILHLHPSTSGRVHSTFLSLDLLHTRATHAALKTINFINSSSAFNGFRRIHVCQQWPRTFYEYVSIAFRMGIQTRKSLVTHKSTCGIS